MLQLLRAGDELSSMLIPLVYAWMLGGPSELPPPSDQALEGAMTIRLIEHQAQAARRLRIVRNSLGMVAGTIQFGLGVYGWTALRRDDVWVGRGAISQMGLGSSTLILGVVFIALPSSLEALRDSPEFARLRAVPHDPAALRAVRQQWKARSEVDRILRLVSGSGYSVAGVAIASIASSRLIPSASSNSPTENLWALTMIGSGVGLLASGLVDLTLPSPTERFYAAYAASHGLARPRGSTRWRGATRVRPTFGGMTIAGSF